MDEDGGNGKLPLEESPSAIRLPHTGAHVVLPGRLFIGPAGAASDESAMRADGITHILNVARELPTRDYSGIEVLHLRCHDSPQQELPLEEASAFIGRGIGRGGRCLVHCNAGRSRSASVVMYHLMAAGGHSLRRSYEYVGARKPDVRPNFGFISQLQEAEGRMLGGDRISLDMDEYKADTLCDILEGSGRSREDVLRALGETRGDGEVALGMLLE